MKSWCKNLGQNLPEWWVWCSSNFMTNKTVWGLTTRERESLSWYFNDDFAVAQKLHPPLSQGPQPLLWYNTVGEPDYPPLSLPCQSKVLWAGKIYRINSKKVNLWHSALKKYFLLNEQEYKITSGYYSKEIFLSLHKNICSERQEISWGRSRSTHSDPHPLPIQSVEGWAPC